MQWGSGNTGGSENHDNERCIRDERCNCIDFSEYHGCIRDSRGDSGIPEEAKIGMVSSPSLIEVIAGRLSEYNAKNVVVDPVMISTSGSRLMQEKAVWTLKNKLFPLAAIVTPNIPEASALTGFEIAEKEDMEMAAMAISKNYGCAVLCKGGHSESDADDILYSKGNISWIGARRIDNPNTHGTGCTL